MSKDKPNDMAREAMARGADEYDKLAVSAETEADLWMQAAGELRRGDMLAAISAVTAARRLRDGRTERHASRLLNFVQVADAPFWEDVVRRAACADVSKLTVDEARAILALHELVGCTDCGIHQMLKERAGQ